jgi:G3E family GTPase
MTEPYQEPEFLPWDGRRVPVTFVGGYLGAGKTTAINELLAVSDRPIAVIVNDVGAINIDARLIRKRHGDTIELTDGCICCNSINEMGAAFDMIRARPVPPDHVIIELSGVAEPQRLVWWGQSAGFVLDGVVVVVAADQLIAGGLPAWVIDALHTQISAADLLVLTKTDLVDATTVALVSQQLSRLAPRTPVMVAGRDTTEPGAIGRFLALGGRRPGGPAVVPDPTLFDAHRVHMLAFPEQVSLEELREWLDQLHALVDGQLVRAKGIAASVDRGLVLVQMVGTRCEVAPLPAAEQQPATDLVIITLAP